MLHVKIAMQSAGLCRITILSLFFKIPKKYSYWSPILVRLRAVFFTKDVIQSCCSGNIPLFRITALKLVCSCSINPLIHEKFKRKLWYLRTKFCFMQLSLRVLNTVSLNNTFNKVKKFKKRKNIFFEIFVKKIPRCKTFCHTLVFHKAAVQQEFLLHVS